MWHNECVNWLEGILSQCTHTSNHHKVNFTFDFPSSAPGHLYLLSPSSLLYGTPWTSLSVPDCGEQTGNSLLARLLSPFLTPTPSPPGHLYLLPSICPSSSLKSADIHFYIKELHFSHLTSQKINNSLNVPKSEWNATSYMVRSPFFW